MEILHVICFELVQNKFRRTRNRNYPVKSRKLKSVETSLTDSLTFNLGNLVVICLRVITVIPSYKYDTVFP